jgi:hypothetical protein
MRGVESTTIGLERRAVKAADLFTNIEHVDTTPRFELQSNPDRHWSILCH